MRLTNPFLVTHLAVLITLIAGAGLVVSIPSLVGSAGQPVQISPEYRRDPTFPRTPDFPFETVAWLEFDAEAGRLVLLQRAAPQISYWSPEGELQAGWRSERLGDPHSVTLRPVADTPPELWITDMAPPNPAGPGVGHCLKRFSHEGNFLGAIGSCGRQSQGTGLDPVQFDRVTDIAFTDDGDLLVTDGDIDGLNNRLLRLSPAGGVRRVWSAPDNKAGQGPGEFHLPHAVTIDQCGRAWVADTLNHRIQIIADDGRPLGAMACFGEAGVYGIDLAPAAPEIGIGQSRLYVTTSPIANPEGGQVHVFEVTMDCAAPEEIPACAPVAHWLVALPKGPPTAMLHTIAVDPRSHDVYLGTLGGPLPPQRWIREWN